MLTQNSEQRDAPPTVACRPIRIHSSGGRLWTLVVDRCPFCKEGHRHVGGLNRRPDYGIFLSKCASTQKRSIYRLVPAMGGAA